MTWPYGDPPEHLLALDEPTWECPADTCRCELVEDGDKVEYTVIVAAEDGERMPDARVRIHYRGRIVNDGMKNADDQARVNFELPHSATSFLVEWAPSHLPLEPKYPYRTRYFATLGESDTQAGRRRLANLGFWTGQTLRDNVIAFQLRYAHPIVSGELDHIEAQLRAFHDTGCPLITKDEQPIVQASLLQGDDPPGPPAPALQPQVPVPPAPNQGTAKTPSPPVQVDLIVDWGTRPVKSGGRRRSNSFWLEPQAVPVAVGVVSSESTWHKETPNPQLPVAFQKGKKKSAVVTLPVGPKLIVVDFDLHATINGIDKSVLAFRQLFALDEAGKLKARRFAFLDYAYTTLEPNPYVPNPRAGMAPVRAHGQGKEVTDGFRIGHGLHPLLAFGPDKVPAPAQKTAGQLLGKQVLVNAEMVDATDLWWALHPEEDVEHYLHPALGGRSRHLRILAWTSGKLPMIWFAALPDAALEETHRNPEKGADLVFLRAPAEINSFTHKPDAKAFAHPQHHKKRSIPGKILTTMWLLARFLLKKRDVSAMQRDGITNVETLQAFSDAILPISPRTPSGTIDPAHPAKGRYISTLFPAFRPGGFESGLNDAKAPHILYLPLASENDAYPAAQSSGLKGIVESAFLCLWNQCAVARDLPQSAPRVDKPNPAQRQLWVAGHSSGNISLAASIDRNGKDISRVMSFGSEDSALDGVQGAVDRASRARKQAGLDPMDVILVTSPDMTKLFSPNKVRNKRGVEVRGISMDVARIQRFFDTGARITCLPPFAEQKKHYTLAPIDEMQPVIRRLLGQWTDDEVLQAAANAGSWNFLFFHEYGVHGGDPGNPFFLQALGTPNPLTTRPTKLP